PLNQRTQSKPFSPVRARTVRASHVNTPAAAFLPLIRASGRCRLGHRVANLAHPAGSIRVAGPVEAGTVLVRPHWDSEILWATGTRSYLMAFTKPRAL